MAVVLDTDTLAPGDRAEAVEAAMRFARVPASLTHDPAVASVRARVEVWELGAGVSLLHRSGTGIRLRRSATQVRRDAESRASLTLLGPGLWRFSQGDLEQVVDSATWGSCLVDQAHPYEFARVGTSEMYAVGIDLDVLGLTQDLVHSAAGRLGSSPLLRLVVNHVLDLARMADQVPSARAGAMLGTATVELVRALITTAATPGEVVPLSEASLLAQTQMYIDRHVTNPDLCPEQIARAHHVSLRQLYAAWSRNDVTLTNHVIMQRLELARRTLAGPTARERTIAAIAHQCGFVDAAHFSRRFRDAYGLSPREWRQLESAGQQRAQRLIMR